MRKIQMTLILAAALATQTVLADEHDMAGNMSKDMPKDMPKACVEVAHACKDAGFMRNGESGKKFWMDCMKPMLLGKTVEGVKVDPNVVKDCRKHKMEKLERELGEFQRMPS